MQSLNWYFYGAPLEPSNPRYLMETDGLNAVLHINEVSTATLGKYTLKIEGTKISDEVIYSKSELRTYRDFMY